jgi:large subunit ribosomal protein L10
MNRIQKHQFVETFSQDLVNYPVVLIMKPSGLDVAGSQKLRAELRSVGGHYRVIKNTLARLSADRSKMHPDAVKIHKLFSGPTAVICAHEPHVAKTVLDFCKQSGKIACVTAFWEKTEIQDVSKMAKIPTLPGMQAQLLGALNSSASTLVRLLGAYRDKLEAAS